jgi:tetrapyrrole methylase family protein/MazG family protein
MTGCLTVFGLGPAGLDRLSAGDLNRLLDPAVTVIVRTEEHPAASQLADRRPVVACDDLYNVADDFDEVYNAIVERVLAAARTGPVLYAVPGSAVVGERAVARLTAAAENEGISTVVIPGESFIDTACATVGIDPISDGLQILDARNLPDPLPLHLPSFITQVDSPFIAGEVALTLGRTLPDSARLVMLSRIGDEDGASTELPTCREPLPGHAQRCSYLQPMSAGLA